MNKFESQLKKAAEKQDPPVLDRQIWLGVKDQLVAQRRHVFRRRIIKWSVAASVLLVLAISYWVMIPGADKDQLVLQKYGLEQYDFPQKVERKLAALNGAKVPQHQVEQFNALKSQLYFLDEQYQNYLVYIEQNGYQEFIGRQIQNYYEIKIELLEKIQKEIEKLKLKKNENSNHTYEVDWQI